MNLVRPIASYGKPAAATLGLVDVDIHPRVRDLSEFRPFVSDADWHRLTTYGIHARHGFAKGYPFPKAAPLACRRDAWPPGGGPPASDLPFLQEQLLDRYGLDVGVLNPLQPSGQGDVNDGLSIALTSAVNDWQIEHWLRHEPRLRGSIVVPYEDGPAAAAEIRKRAGDPRFCQVFLLSRTCEPLGRRRYWPIYEAAAEVGLPVGIHAFGYSGHAMTSTGWPSFYVEEVQEHATSAQAQVASMVVEGVFERFPGLNVVMIECGFGWMPSLAWRLDGAWKRLRDEVPHLTRAPSEIMREHVFVSTQPIEEPERPEHLLDAMEWIGWDRILFASDYPHWDFDDPRMAIPSFIPEEKRAAIYGGNANRIYRFR
ncbi:amidohydrolase family protein [Roseomonas sp. HJA6]|uniref:Amidohydrolase family protein n=1 Tax=Roseomonas alba TaxID=2846776 RepID=A0ABS7A2W6_9PROT|nr:amidohydrolase family protein [Neoroseomonas alba]MBW6396636.1 amidohydrolase family protein [Neoroseomonas alba]